jgi:hypothetical protein
MWGRAGIYLLLALLVQGLFALDRGLWQDDVAILAVVASQDHGSIAGLLAPILAPTRRLLGLPFALALATPRPVACLQLLYGVTWLGLGLLAHALARLLAPGRPRLAYLAGALTLCATSDFLTDSVVSLGYDVSVLAFFAGLCLLLRWQRQGEARLSLIGSALLMSASLWTMEAALPSVLLVPLLLWAADGRRFSRRAAVGALLWLAAALPFLAIFVPFLLDPHGYAATALLPLSPHERLQRTAALFFNNFAPWRWAFARPVWYPRPDPVIPIRAWLPAVGLGTAAFLWGAWRVQDAAPESAKGEDASRDWLLAATSLLMAFASNAALAGLQLATIFYRTQVVSRVWASLFLAIVSDRLIRRLGGRWPPGLLLPTVFVALGLAGGLERQDFFLASWRQHRVELASIVEQAPSLRPEALLLLQTPPAPAYLATEAPYLAEAWAVVLYRDPSFMKRLFLWAPERGTGCLAEERRLRCWEEGQADCFAEGTCEGRSLPYERLVLMTYVPEERRFRLLREIPAALLGAHPESGRGYAPEAMILRRPVDSFQRGVLFNPPLLARYLPGFCPDAGCEALSTPAPR